jgi:hypothetical protein
VDSREVEPPWATSDGIVKLDLTGGIEFVNPATRMGATSR